MRREYPEGPIPAVGAIALQGDAVLLIRRGHEPFKGYWTIPGGAVELGEHAEEAVVRETLEEAGVKVAPLELVGAFDNILLRDGKVWFHYVILDYLVQWVSGEPRAGDGELDSRWVALEELGKLQLTPQAKYAIDRAIEARRR